MLQCYTYTQLYIRRSNKMSGCPNCRAYVSTEQMFCRSCGFRLENDFQLSTQSLGLPAAPRIPATKYTGAQLPPQASWRRYMVPAASFMFALFMGGYAVSMMAPEIVPQLDNTVSYSYSAPFNERAYIGVYILQDQELSGAIVDRVIEASPAEQAGLLSGDRITAINNQEVSTPSEVISYLSNTAAGANVNITIERNDNTQTISLHTVKHEQLQVNAPCNHHGFLGIETVSTTDSTGASVGKVYNNSPAESFGLQTGDIIHSMDGIAIDNTTELGRHMRATFPGQTIKLEIERNDQMLTLPIILGHKQ